MCTFVFLVFSHRIVWPWREGLQLPFPWATTPERGWLWPSWLWKTSTALCSPSTRSVKWGKTRSVVLEPTLPAVMTPPPFSPLFVVISDISGLVVCVYSATATINKWFYFTFSFLEIVIFNSYLGQFMLLFFFFVLIGRRSWRRPWMMRVYQMRRCWTDCLLRAESGIVFFLISPLYILRWLTVYVCSCFTESNAPLAARP